MKKLFKIICCIGAAMMLISVAHDMRADNEARKKARYYYMAGAIEKAKGNDDASYEYNKRAYNIDPGYAEAAWAYGISRLEIPLDTMQSDTEIDRSLAMMRSYIDKYPDDVNESQYYGYVSTQLGNTPEAVRVLERAYALNPATTSILLQLSDAYAVNKEIDKAVEAIDRYERSEGMNQQVTTRKVSYLLANSDTVNAVKEVSRLVATEPRNLSYNILKANLFDIIGQKDSALCYYLKAENLDPEAGSAKLALAEFYKEQGDSVSYDRKMYDVLLCEDLDLDMKSEMLAYYLQELLSGKQDTQRGDYLFSVLENQYPHEPRLLDLAARYSAAKSNFDEAIEHISYALDLDPTNLTYWGQLMAYYTAAERYDESLEAYQKAKNSVEPDNSLKLYYAFVAQTAKRYDLALDTFRQMADEVQPGLDFDKKLTLYDLKRDISLEDLNLLSTLVASMGDVYHMMGEEEKAYLMFDNALEFNPSNALAANNYAYFLCIGGGDMDKALELSRKTITGDNADNPTYLDTFAWINYTQGNYATALVYQEKAVENSKIDEEETAEIYDHYGDILVKFDRWQDATDAWQKAAKLMEDNQQTSEESYPLIKKKISDAAPKLESLGEENKSETENN